MVGHFVIDFLSGMLLAKMYKNLNTKIIEYNKKYKEYLLNNQDIE